MAKNYAKSKSRSQRGHFIMLVAIVYDSPGYRQLSHTASRVLTMIHSQYRGSNNGDLSAPLSLAKKWGIRGSATLAKAIKELQEARFILRTRDPTRDKKCPQGQCSLFAITWEKIDECNGKHDLRPTGKASMAFLNGEVVSIFSVSKTEA